MVEPWFNITKTNILNGYPADTIADFERRVRPSVVGRLQSNLRVLDEEASKDDIQIRSKVRMVIKLILGKEIITLYTPLFCSTIQMQDFYNSL